jgi:16S rRNA (uracil1498-N3)-methyltransferase
MSAPRIFCDLRLGPGAQFALPQDAANHIGRALRLRVGDPLVVFDGRGGEYEAQILRIDRDRVEVKTGAFREPERESPLAIGLVQGLPSSAWPGSSRWSASAASCVSPARARRAASRTGSAW